MQVNRVNQQTNFEGVYAKLRKRSWTDLTAKVDIPKRSMQELLDKASKRIDLELDPKEVYVGENLAMPMGKFQLILTDAEAERFDSLADSAKQKSFLESFFDSLLTFSKEFTFTKKLKN